HCPRPDHGPLAYRHAAQDHRPRADGGAAADPRGHDVPVSRPLWPAVGPRRPGHLVIDEQHPVANEALVLDRHALADERVAADFAAPADGRVLLHLDEGADAGLVADATAVQVDEGVQHHAHTQAHVGGDAAIVERAHKVMRPPWALMLRWAAS